MDYQLFYNIEEIQSPGKSMEDIQEELYGLWQECFGDTKVYTDFYFKWKLRDNRILTLYKENRLCSMVHLNPYEVMVRGRQVPSNYIVGVATRREERKQGYMRLLLQAALCRMQEEHMPFTYLMPASEDIYLPFDFRVIYQQEDRKLLYQEDRELFDQENRKMFDRENRELLDQENRKMLCRENQELPDQENRELLDQENRKMLCQENQKLLDQENHELLFRDTKKEQFLDASVKASEDDLVLIPLEPGHIQEMDELADHSNRWLDLKYDVYVKRSRCYYERFLQELESTGGKILLCRRKQRLVGYASYLAEEEVTLLEQIHEPGIEEEFKEALRSYLTGLRTEESVTGTEKKELPIPKIMARIVDFKAFAALLSAREEMKLVIQVKDPIVKENNGTFALHFTDSGCQVIETSQKPEIIGEIAGLTQLFFGTGNLDTAQKMISAPSREAVRMKLGKLESLRRIYINDIT